MLRETCHWSRTFYLCDIANTILSGDLGPTQPLFQYECLEKHATDSVLFNLCDIANTILRGGDLGPTQPFPSVREIYLFPGVMDKRCNPSTLPH